MTQLLRIMIVCFCPYEQKVSEQRVLKTTYDFSPILDHMRSTEFVFYRILDTHGFKNIDPKPFIAIAIVVKQKDGMTFD